MLLKNKSFFILTIIIILLSSITIAQMCEVAHARNTLRKALFDYLSDPPTAQMVLPKIKDLLNFYLNISEGTIRVDCSGKGQNSGIVYETIINEADNIIISLPTCVDGTPYGECSSTKPKYCHHAKKLMDRCKICGCPENKVCKGQRCRKTKEKIACNINADCGTSDYIGDYFCQNNSVYRNYTKSTCLNPSETNSSCITEMTAVVIDDCALGEECIEGQSSCQTITPPENLTCSDGTLYGKCSATKPLYCENGNLVNNCGVCGCDSGKECQVNGSCVTEVGNEVIWVADYGNQQLVKLSSTGEELLRITLDIGPVMVKVNPSDGTIWIGAAKEDWFIIKLSPSGEELVRMGPIQELDTSDSISVNPTDGTVWVSSAPNEVIKLASKGDILFNVTGFGDSFGVAVYPSDGSVWVAAFNGDVVKFSSEGAELVRLNISDITGVLAEAIAVNPSDGSVWTGVANWASAGNGQVVKLASDGTELLRVDGFYHIYAISINPTDGSVWLTETGKNQVVKLSSNGKELLRIGGFNEPHDISVNPTDGTAWVADNLNNQVVKLSPSGIELLRLDGFNSPTGIFVNP